MSSSIVGIQTRAFIVDAYRELNSKRLFWITMMLSGLVVVAFAAMGLTDKGISIFGWELPLPFFNAKIMAKDTFYKLVFSNLGIGFWLSWIACALALISTASLIPDFASSGAIELTLSKPINRLRLFLTKYFVGLLFVALQVSVFTVLCFFVIGIRGGAWLPKLFLAIPIVVLFFSYLYCVSALVGLVTRSTIAALLVTLLFWGALFLMNTTDMIFLQLRTNAEVRHEELQKRIPRLETAAARKLDLEARESAGDAEPVTTPAKPDPSKYTQAQLDAASTLLPATRKRLVEQAEAVDRWTFWSRVAIGVKTVLPKTTETRQVLDSALIDSKELEKFRAPGEEDGATLDVGEEDDIKVDRREIRMRTEDRLRARSTLWTLGTSFGFEVVILGIACWIFSRRDF